MEGKRYDTEIRREGTAIVLPALPKEMPTRVAIETLQAVADSEEQRVKVVEVIDAFVWDAAYALKQAQIARYGVILPKAIPTMFGEILPETIGIEVAPGVVEQVPWGRTGLPGVNGYLDVGMDLKDGRVILKIQATVLKKFEGEIKALADEARRYVREHSIYRGKTFSMKFAPPDGDYMQVVPKFIDVSKTDENQLILNRDVEAAVATSVYTPLKRYLELGDLGIPFKRGVVFAGRWGTGKSLTARIAAKIANENEVTFILVSEQAELAQAVSFARQYQPCVVFLEDIDRVTSGERDEAMDRILNVIDGIDSKSCEIMVILTTNNVEAINQAMMRPGRLDAVIDFAPPDAEAVERLIRMYAGKTLAPDTDLKAAGKLLSGEIPAVITEVVQRSKLAALKMTAPGERVFLTGEALAESARTMQMQLELLNKERAKDPNPFELIGQGIGAELKKALALWQQARDASGLYMKGEDGNWPEYHDSREAVMEAVPEVPEVLKTLAKNGHS